VMFAAFITFRRGGHIAILQPVATIIVQIFDPVSFIARPTHPDFLLAATRSRVVVAVGGATGRTEIPVPSVGPDFGGYACLFGFHQLGDANRWGDDTPQIMREHSVHGPTFPPGLLQGVPRGSVAVSERTHSIDFSRSM
jgi:hypothetical protein